MLNFRFYAFGHPAVSSTHPSTLELTREAGLTTNGDCIIAVASSAGLRDFPSKMKDALAKDTAKACLTLRMGARVFTVEGRGARGLTLSHPTEMVVRTSSFISDRTLMIRANRAAVDIPRPFVQLLQDRKHKVSVEISVKP